MKRIVKTAEEKFESLKEFEQGFEFDGGMVKYDLDNNKTIVFIDADKEVRTYHMVPDDLDFKTLAETISYHSSGTIQLDDFIDYHSEPDSVVDFEIHEAWADYLKDSENDNFEFELIQAEYEEFDALESLNEFKDKIRHKDLDWIKSNFDCVDVVSDEDGITHYKVYNEGDTVKFEIGVNNDLGSIYVSNFIALVNEEMMDDEVKVEDAELETTFMNKYVDESVLALTPEQKISLELLKMAFKSAKESGLRIFDTPELGSFALNGKKLKLDKVLCKAWKEESDEINFLLKADSILKTEIPGLTDESVFWRWYGGEETEYGLSVSES